MSYTKIVDYAAKDALLTGNPAKVVKGTELGAEFDAIATADALNIKSDGSVTITSAQLAAIVTNETGTGALVFGTGPTITLANATGLPITTGATMSTARILGRTTASTGAVEELTVTAPLSIASGALTTSMATSRLLGRTTASAGVAEEISVAGSLTLSAGVLTGGSSMVLATPQASTSGVAIDFTSIPAGTKRITISFVGVSTNGTSSMLFQIGDSGGIETSGYLGSGNWEGVATVQFTAGFGFPRNAAGDILHGALTLTLVNSSTNTWVAAGVFSTSSTADTMVLSGSKPLSATLDRVRCTTANGTDAFDAGEINIIYE